MSREGGESCSICLLRAQNQAGIRACTGWRGSPIPLWGGSPASVLHKYACVFRLRVFFQVLWLMSSSHLPRPPTPPAFYYEILKPTTKPKKFHLEFLYARHLDFTSDVFILFSSLHVHLSLCPSFLLIFPMYFEVNGRHWYTSPKLFGTSQTGVQHLFTFLPFDVKFTHDGMQTPQGHF